MMDLFINLMVLQALMGAFDTLYHHEFKVALPQNPGARLELSIHAVRAMLYSILFIGLAWYEWGGLWVWLLISIVLIEVVLTLWDFVVEDATRLLPASERVTHTLLAINGGAAFVLLALTLPEWFSRSTDFYAIDYGWQSWFLTVGAIGVGLSGIRDGLASWSVQRLNLKLDLDLGGHKRVLISGGTGFIGSALVRELLYKGHDITVISRQPLAAAMKFFGKVRAVNSAAGLSDDERFDVIINLAGAPVVGLPWSTHRKQLITQSRLQATRDLLSFVRKVNHRPVIWIQASAIGFYGPQTDSPVDETALAGNGFAAELCQQWEQAIDELQTLSVRYVILRFGLVFGRSGGSLPMMLLSFRFGAGAVIGDGKQYMSWIHIEDLLRVIAWSIKDNTVSGVFNVVAPDVPTYAQFAKASGRMLHRPVMMRIPAGLLRMLLGEMASMFVDGPEIVPSRLQDRQFEFRFPDLRTALMDLT